jgi:hypothetical protein
MKNIIILTIIAEIVSDCYDLVNCPESVGKILRCLSAAFFAKILSTCSRVQGLGIFMNICTSYFGVQKIRD